MDSTKDEYECSKIFNIRIFWVSDIYLYSNYYFIDIQIYLNMNKIKVYSQIFFLFRSIFPKNISFLVHIFNIFYFGPRQYSDICSNFSLKYIQIFVLEVFNLSNIYAYLFEKVLVFQIYLDICSEPFSKFHSSLYGTTKNLGPLDMPGQYFAELPDGATD